MSNTVQQIYNRPCTHRIEALLRGGSDDCHMSSGPSENSSICPTTTSLASFVRSISKGGLYLGLHLPKFCWISLNQWYLVFATFGAHLSELISKWQRVLLRGGVLRRLGGSSQSGNNLSSDHEPALVHVVTWREWEWGMSGMSDCRFRAWQSPPLPEKWLGKCGVNWGHPSRASLHLCSKLLVYPYPQNLPND